ncbi:hypothetical protein BD414DRAFT_174166 [Trametes punicea]|nr:hypothetical protein BD414DRAFT_174166 [Trametes punicea]
MSHHRRPSAGACEVVPNDDELACALRGFGEGPRLCSVHRKEYGRLTATYKGLSEKAEKLYAELLANDWTDETLWNVDNVTTALTTASSCIHAIDEEIVSRQEHHRRFFVELHDGHEAWIQRLRKRLSEVEAIAEQLQTCKAMLVEDERRRNEARRQAEARRQRDASRATRMYSHWSGPHTTSRVGTTAYRHEGYSNTVLEPVSIKAPLRRCIANLHDRQPSRCSFEALQDLWWCQAHSEEQRKASSALRVARTKLHGMEDSISLIRRRPSKRRSATRPPSTD